MKEIPRHPVTGLIDRPLSALASSVNWFRGEATKRGAPIKPRSTIANALERLEAFRERVLVDDRMKTKSVEEAYELMAEVTGVDFLTKAIHKGVTNGLDIPDELWRGLSKGDPLITRPAVSSTARNKTWELVIASMVSSFASDVRFDEPDILCAFEGRTFAVAAKIPYASGKLLDLAEHGLKQAKGRAEAILVFANAVQIYSQLDVLLVSKARNDTKNDQMTEFWKASVTRWLTTFALEQTVEKFAKEAAARPVGFGLFVPMYIVTAGVPRPFFYTHMPITGSDSSPDYRFAKSFLRACNEILSFVP